MSIKFENLKGQNLIVDEIYEGGKAGNTGDDPLSKLFPKLGNMSGFRKVKRHNDKSKLAYVVLYTSMSEL